MTFPIGTKLGRYEIRSRIGEGGMGEVYLAEDTRLHRKVALKVLPHDLAANRDRMRRFEQEATAAAALNHPNIAHVYEIGESDGVNFIAMEYVDGATLREKIHGEPTELRKLLRYLQQVAEGLAKAHAAGIVHRDLKPDNVMITHDGYAKILDFGLAKLIEQTKPPVSEAPAAEAPTAVMQQPLSTPGVVMGTVGYMSPEQAQGKQVDQRSDIFSFGCILYEAATSQRAFESESTIDTLHKIVHAPVPPVKDVNPSAPADLTRIARRCLAKDPDERYQSIKEAAIELRELRRELEGAEELDTTVPPSSVGRTVSSTPSGATTVSGTPHLTASASSAEYIVKGITQHKLAAVIGTIVLVAGIIGLVAYLHGRNATVAIKSIAVMPFANEGGNAEAEYLSDGMTETLISNLSQLSNLSVKARSSVFRYKGQETSPQTIGRELNVQAILNGRVAQRGDQLTLTLELVDAQTENVIWSEQYNRTQADLVALQSEIARDVSAKLKTRLSGADQQKLMKSYTVNPEAYQLYLKGRFYWNKRTGESLKKSIEYFNQAIEKDPNYALAYAGMADAYSLIPGYSAGPPQEYLPKAKAAAMKALEIDNTLAEAHTALANALYDYDWNFAESNREFQRAIELNPNYPTAHHWYGENLAVLGRFDEGIAQLKLAQELDPLSLIINADLGEVYTYARQYDNAIEQLRKTIEMDQGFYYAHWRLGLVYEMKGSNQEAIAEYRKARQLDDDPFVLALLGHAYAVSGERAEALKTVEQLKEISQQRYVSAYSFSVLYGGLGEKDQAFQWLEKAYQDRADDLRQLKVDPLLDNLRSDPRFTDLVRRVGLPQ